MAKELNIELARQIEDAHERIFAVAVLSAFSQIKIFAEPTIHAMSGKMNRITRPDFLLLNKVQQELYVEITCGNGKSKRKKRQRKTASLAGFGEQYLLVTGEDIDTLATSSSTHLKTNLLAILKGRFNGNLFKF